MKKLIKKSLLKLVQNDSTGWKMIEPFLKLGRYLDFERKKYTLKRDENKEKTFDFMFKDKMVLNGPFKGMKYPSITSSGSTVYPKLIGCYEKELNDVIESICKNKYTEIIDIGSAEGYYAIGLSLRITEARVYAYDTDPSARDKCLQMARLNGVMDRVEIKSFCSSEELRDFSFNGRGLIICDCEGYELELFNAENLANLSQCDLLIETHDLMNINISTFLTKLFSATHEILVVKSIDDIEKAKTYEYKITEGLTLEAKKELFAEDRGRIMEWLYCKSKK